MDASSLDDKYFQDLGVDLSLFPDQDPFLNFSNVPDLSFADFVTPDVLRDFSEPILSPMPAQLPEQPSCYDDFDCGLALSPTPTPPPVSFRSSASPKRSELADHAAPSAAPATRMRSAVPTRAAAAAASAPKLHPTYAPSPSLSIGSPGSSMGGGRGCPKRHRKTIQLKRQEQQGRLESLTTRNAKLQEAIRLASTEVSAARQTLYTVLKTARQGHLDAFSPAP